MKSYRHKKMSEHRIARFCSVVLTGCMLAASVIGCGNEDGMAGVSDSLADGGEYDSVTGSPGAAGSAAGEGQAAYISAGEIITASEMFTKRDLSGEYDAEKAEEITLSEGEVTITEEGIYLLSGTLTDGMVIVDADKSDKVQLVLDGVEIDNDANAAIYVKQADKVFVTLAEGSENSLTSRGYTSLDGNHIDGVIYAKSDLVINGAGSLTVNAVEGHGIVSRDDLKVTGGAVTVAAEKQGLSGKDSVRIGGGSIQITAGKDGIHAENDEDTEKGFVYIADGVVQIMSDGDGISATSVIQVDGGMVDIIAGGGSGNRSVAVDENGDAIHSDLNVVINGGELSLATGDDGIHADETTSITGGNINISHSYEGIEGNNVEISGGSIRLYATDDGLNAAGGNGDDGVESDVPHIRISGGVIYVHADGDGLDSNGDLLVSGGEVYISGPESSANGALDYERNGQITGGIVVAAGNSGMAMNFGDTSTQGAVLITTASHPAGTVIALQDSGGKELVSYTGECMFNSVVISCPEMVLGGTYTVMAGEEAAEVTLSDSLIYGSGFGMGGFGNGGRMPGGGMSDEGQLQMPGGGMPDGARPQMPGGGMPDGEQPAIKTLLAVMKTM